MKKQFNSNQEMESFVRDYIKTHFDLSKSDNVFESKFGMIHNIFKWIGSWDSYARIIIDGGYEIDNLRSGICDELLEAYDKLASEEG